MCCVVVAQVESIQRTSKANVQQLELELSTARHSMARREGQFRVRLVDWGGGAHGQWVGGWGMWRAAGRACNAQRWCVLPCVLGGIPVQGLCQAYLFRVSAHPLLPVCPNLPLLLLL